MRIRKHTFLWFLQIALPVALAALFLSSLPWAEAIVHGGPATRIRFQKGRVPAGLSWSPNLTLTEDRGLVPPKPKEKTSYEVWLRTQKVPAGLGWRPPSSVRVTLSVYGTAASGFPLNSYLRYGCDGRHWSTWYRMEPSKETRDGAMKTYVCRIEVPGVARERYRALMLKWWKTQPVWPSDEAALCRWIIKQEPDFFSREFPFVGYLQILQESQGLETDFALTQMEISVRWTVGGKHSTPRDGSEPDSEKEWSFLAPEATK